MMSCIRHWLISSWNQGVLSIIARRAHLTVPNLLHVKAMNKPSIAYQLTKELNTTIGINGVQRRIISPLQLWMLSKMHSTATQEQRHFQRLC